MQEGPSTLLTLSSGMNSSASFFMGCSYSMIIVPSLAKDGSLQMRWKGNQGICCYRITCIIFIITCKWQEGQGSTPFFSMMEILWIQIQKDIYPIVF